MRVKRWEKEERREAGGERDGHWTQGEVSERVGEKRWEIRREKEREMMREG